jgi:TM2 domain-containing membrane protein YozV
MSKDAGLAVVFTVLAPGLGHVYLERYVRALIIFLAILLSLLLIPTGIGVVTFPVVWLLAAYDAKRLA